ncbi:MAG: hypothetical protein IJW43_01075 [Clostridia bacterium]|nr:hypothetical protein [Clostridia bacterium]
MRKHIKKIISLTLAIISLCSIFSFVGCSNTVKVNYYLNDKILYIAEVKKGEEYDLSSYEFTEEYFTFNGWTDELGLPLTTITPKEDVNVYASATPQLILLVNGIQGKNYVGDTGVRVLMEIKKPELEGWSISWESDKPEDLIGTEVKRGVEFYFIGHTNNLVTVTYSNGFESITATQRFECYHWDAHMSFYFMPGEPTVYDDNAHYAMTDIYREYTVPLNGRVAFEDVRMRKGNLIFRDAYVEAVKIEDESILAYDKEAQAFVGLKAGTTKVTVYGRWYSFHGKTITGGEASYDNLPWNDPSSPKKGSGSEGLTREMTITVK